MSVVSENRDGISGAASAVALLERDREVAQLDEFISQLKRPGARMALIDGAAGIGKTTLLSEARTIAASDGIRVLNGRGSVLEREFPFGVVRQLFEPALVDSKVRKQAFTGAAAGAAAIFDFGGEGEAEAADGSGFAVLHGLYWLTLNIAGEDPLLLAVDDLHWVDNPSLRFLAYLLRRVEDLPIAVVAATRPNEPGMDQALTAELSADPLSLAVSPGGLSRDGVRGVISARLGQEPDTAFATACHTATGGNPLLLHELTKAIQVDGTPPVAANIGVVDELGPRAASRAVLLRLARLSGDAGKIVRAAAVFDEGFTVPMLAALAEIDEQAAARAVGELIQAEILRGEQPLGFVHPLIRAAVYQDISLGERELEHARAARLLADAGAPAERIASHLLVVPPRGDSWVAGTLREAARKAMHKGAPDGAVRYFQRALDEPPPEEELTAAQFELGLAQALTNAPAAVEHLSVAYERLTDPLSVGLAANVLARAMIWQAPAEAAAFARRAASRMPDEPADYRLSIEAVEAALTAFGVDSPEALERLLPFRDPNRIDGSVGSKMMAAVAAWQWSLANGPADVCVELADKALAGGELIAADHGLLPMFAIATYHVADSEQVMAAWEQMLAETHRSGSMFAITTTYLWRGFTLYRRGDLEEAALSLRSAVDTFPSYGYGVSGMAYTGAHLTRILYESGDPAGARAAFDVSPEPPPDADAYRYWALAKVAVLMHEGREAEVAEVLDKIPRHLPWIVNPADTFWRCLKAEALDRLDRRDEALELVQEELELARAWGVPATVGRVLRTLGTLERENGLEHLAEAVEQLEQSTTKLEYAKALCAFGTTLRLARKQTDAREPLHKALDLANLCGAAPLAEHARTELHATGARPRRDAVSGVASLTPSESRVAGLAADGMSNREIAQELYVTPKTVEVHLSNTYRKLEIRSRRELSGALGPA